MFGRDKKSRFEGYVGIRFACFVAFKQAGTRALPDFDFLVCCCYTVVAVYGMDCNSNQLLETADVYGHGR